MTPALTLEDKASNWDGDIAVKVGGCLSSFVEVSKQKSLGPKATR